MAAALIFLSQKQKKLKNNNCKGMTVGKKGHERDVLARNPQCQSQVQRSPQEVLPKAAASREWGENQHEDSTMDNTSLSMQQIEEREREKQKLMLAIREQQALIQQHQILLGPSLNYHSPQTYLTGMPSEQQRQWLPQQQGQLPIVHSSLFVPTNPSFRDPQSMPRNW
ncbi:hypothetical protein BCR41DRAFT_36427 [Lobosporangium transversale]|uniref:Uncharacterized protein n=1 Tax=Lobosporangium transversale TaxID=64571 RepID=A0A1Y2GRK1_9FUNG|nr:hypothetical protein BCR41DRAFT_36427 [Lobosporangium transversale]ORZ20137.1 hypothetical protein BCR41DRAFT_36427 [Lobosporangium transversale]|eukprot:XP_021882677.1 hypothetical protein BCR41DRAFT_36427 [Lobosporangium transversale]